MSQRFAPTCGRVAVVLVCIAACGRQTHADSQGSGGNLGGGASAHGGVAGIGGATNGGTHASGGAAASAGAAATAGVSTHGGSSASGGTGGSSAGNAAQAGAAASSGASEAGAAGAGGSETASGAPVGNPCIPLAEQSATYAGAALSELVIETQNPACASGICVANHFQGRVTCPYGQTASDVATLSANDGGRCRVPAASGASSAQAVSVAVAPQRVDRRADATVTCSCHCAGPATDIDYCSCPNGTECVELVLDVGLPGEDPNTVGSYCVKLGTEYNPASSGPVCTRASSDASTDCGNGRANP